MEVEKLRQDYLRKNLLPMYKRKLFGRRLFAFGIIGGFALTFTYSRVVRVLDLIEYEVWIK
jgi:hypothetical protein